MIEEQAQVVAVGPGRAWVETRRRSACGACSSSGACGTSTVARLFGEGANRLELDDTLGLSVGDRVVIGIGEGTLARASLAAYLLPLLALMLAAFAAGSAGAGEEGSALAGLLGLGLGLWLTGRLAGNAGGRDRYRPLLLRRDGPVAPGFFELTPRPVRGGPQPRGIDP